MADHLAVRDTLPDALPDVGSSSLRSRLTLPGWSRRWEFWLVMVLGAFLRLWHVDRALMLGDQTNLLALARAAITHGAVPVTGIPSSIGTLNPPLSTYVLVPIALFTSNPLPQVIALALWNIVGVLICYAVTERFFGRTAAAWSALLFATCTPVVAYSRFLWQQNYIAPLLALWLMTCFAAVTNGRRRWFVANVTLLVAAALLHPTAALLAPVAVVAWLLAQRRPRWREYVVAGAVLVLLALPTLIWELASGFVDVPALVQYESHPAHVNLDILPNLYEALGITDTWNALPSQFGHLFPLITVAACLTCAFLVAGYLALTVHVVAPLVHFARRHGGLRALWPLVRRRANAADAAEDNMQAFGPRWRTYVLLWLAVTLPIVLMLRHSSPLYPHYFIVLYPSAFLVFGLAVQWATGLRHGHAELAAAPRRAWRQRVSQLRGGVTYGALASCVLVALAGILVVGQAAQTVLFIASIEGQHFQTSASYGYPLDEQIRAGQLLDQLQRQQPAAQVVVLGPTTDYYADLTQLLVTEHSNRTGLSGNCLLMPPAGTSTLYVSTNPANPAAQFLASLPAAHVVGQLAMPGDAPLTFYRLDGAPALQPNETTVASGTFTTQRGPALQLETYARVQPDLLRLRWQMLTSSAVNQPQQWYDIHAAATTANGSASQPQGVTRCAPSHWAAGSTLFTWVTLPHTATTAQPQLGVQVYHGLVASTTFSYHGVRFIAGVPTWRALTPSERLTPEPTPGAATDTTLTAGAQGQVIAASGTYLLPATAP